MLNLEKSKAFTANEFERCEVDEDLVLLLVSDDVMTTFMRDLAWTSLAGIKRRFHLPDEKYWMLLICRSYRRIILRHGFHIVPRDEDTVPAVAE